MELFERTVDGFQRCVHMATFLTGDLTDRHILHQHVDPTLLDRGKLCDRCIQRSDLLIPQQRTQFCMNGDALAGIIADAPIKMPPDEDAGHPGSVVASFTAQPTTDPPVFSQTATAPKSTQPTQQQVQPPVQQSHASAPEPPKTLDEFLRVMTIEQAKAVKVDFGRFSGWSLGEIAMKSPGDLAWYVKNYSGHNLALKAGATKLLETVGQMAS